MDNYSIEGFQDISFEELRGYDKIINTIENNIRLYGYKQVLTPSFESYDMYNIDGALSRKEMFKLVDQTGQILVLRPDATIPITRMAATAFKNKNEILKLAYITTVFRNSPSKTDFRKEFMQAGVEYLGSSKPECDGEIIALAVEILKSLGLNNIHIDMGQVSFFNAIFDGLELKDNDISTIYSLIENKNMGELKILLDYIHLPLNVKNILWDIPMLFGKFESTITKAKELCINDKMHMSIEYMEETFEILKAYGLQDMINVDFGFTNQFNYYTGLIFKGYVNDFGEAVLSGGRYDQLSSTFGVERPASGFGINISLLMDILNSSFNFDHYFDILLLYDSCNVKEAVTFSKVFRENNISTDCMHMNGFNYSNLYNYKIMLKVIDGKLFKIYRDKDILISIDEIITIFKGGN